MPETGSVVPQNVPGFPFRPGWTSDENDGELEQVTLEDDAGNVVATTLKTVEGRPFERLIVPSNVLAPGAYTLQFVDACASGTETLRHTLTVTEAEPFPSDLGSLRATPSPSDLVQVYAGSRCVGSLKAANMRIEIDPSPAFAAFQPVATYSVTVDGADWRGAVKDYDGLGPADLYDPLVVYAACEEKLGYARGLTPGKHTVEVRAHIEGAPSDPAPATIEIDLKCPVGAGSGTNATPEAAAASAAPAASDAGCSFVPRTESASSGAVAATLGAVALVLGALRRRRD